MPDFSQYTFKNLLRAMLERVPNTYDKRDTSPIPTALGPAAWALEGFYLALGMVQSQGYIQTATGESLDKLAVISGVTRRAAVPAVRLGVFSMAVPIGARFSTINGELSVHFTVTAATDNPLQFKLMAETPGAAGNEYAGPILPITTIPGLTSAAITDILIPGEDEEDDDSFRRRIETALTDPGYGGNIANYRDWAGAVPGVGPVQVYPVWDGGGTVLLSILGADFLPASDILLEEVQNAIDPPPNQGLGMGQAPIGATVTVVTASTVAVDIAAAVSLAPGYTLVQVRPLILAELAKYLETIREGWGTPVSTSSFLYNADVYLARVTAAILSVAGVRNVAGVTLNGSGADLVLAETAEDQQVPVLGTVSLSDGTGGG